MPATISCGSNCEISHATIQVPKTLPRAPRVNSQERPKASKELGRSSSTTMGVVVPYAHAIQITNHSAPMTPTNTMRAPMAGPAIRPMKYSSATPRPLTM